MDKEVLAEWLRNPVTLAFKEGLRKRREGAKDNWANSPTWNADLNARQQEFCAVMQDIIDMDVDALKGLVDED